AWRSDLSQILVHSAASNEDVPRIGVVEAQASRPRHFLSYRSLILCRLKEPDLRRCRYLHGLSPYLLLHLRPSPCAFDRLRSKSGGRFKSFLGLLRQPRKRESGM